MILVINSAQQQQRKLQDHQLSLVVTGTVLQTEPKITDTNCRVMELCTYTATTLQTQ